MINKSTFGYSASFITTLCVLIIIGFTGCRKDVPLDETPGYKAFTVKVVTDHNNQPVANCPINMIKRQWITTKPPRGYFVYTKLKPEATTNSQGYATLLIPNQLIVDSALIYYDIVNGHSSGDTIPDSNSISWLYSGSVEDVYRYGKAKYNSTLKLIPNCTFQIYTYRKDWEPLNIDSVEIHSTTYNNRLVLIRKQYFSGPLSEYFYTTFVGLCSQTNQIVYHYYVNGVKSKTYSLDFFLPFNARFGSNGQPSITLTF
jgi:hypothetical protein